MYLSFADNCVVHVEDINENLVSFIRSSNWKYHIIDNKTEVDISIKRINFGILLPDMILHPNFEASGEYFVFKDVGGFRVGFDFSVIGRGKAEILVEENYQV